MKCEFIFSYLSLNNINGPMEVCGLCSVCLRLIVDISCHYGGMDSLRRLRMNGLVTDGLMIKAVNVFLQPIIDYMMKSSVVQ